MSLSRSLSEQNADRKCSGRNDSLHRRQTPATPPSLRCLLLARTLPRSTSAASAAAAGGAPLPRLSRQSFPCVAPLPAARPFLFFPVYFPPPPCLLVRGTRPKFMLKPALRVCEEGILLEKEYTFWCLFFCPA